MNKFFGDLLESVQQMDEIHRNERPPSRHFSIDELQVKEIRKAEVQAADRGGAEITIES